MKVLITGAHFTPAQAVIEELKKNPEIEIVYVGRKTTLEGDKTPSLESQILPQTGIKFISIIAGRLRRNLFDLYTLISLFKIPIGFIQAFFIMLKEQPDVVVSFGGYVGVPLVFSAWILSIPSILHEQTTVSGLANRISGFFADKVAVTFERQYKFKKEKIVLTGNSLRSDLIFNHQKPQKLLKECINRKTKQLPLIYITGGNQGSHIINETVDKILDQLTKKAIIIHQTGDSKFKDFDKLIKHKQELSFPERYYVEKWFDVLDLAYIYKNSDLVISRGGANTLLELAYFGLPALIIPIPYLNSDEQHQNAIYFQKLGLCEVLQQKHLTPNTLFDKVSQILQDLEKYKKMQ